MGDKVNDILKQIDEATARRSFEEKAKSQNPAPDAKSLEKHRRQIREKANVGRSKPQPSRPPYAVMHEWGRKPVNPPARLVKEEIQHYASVDEIEAVVDGMDDLRDLNIVLNRAGEGELRRLARTHWAGSVERTLDLLRIQYTPPTPDRTAGYSMMNNESVREGIRVKNSDAGIEQAKAEAGRTGVPFYVNSTTDGIRVEREPVSRGWAGAKTLYRVDPDGSVIKLNEAINEATATLTSDGRRARNLINKLAKASGWSALTKGVRDAMGRDAFVWAKYVTDFDPQYFNREWWDEELAGHRKNVLMQKYSVRDYDSYVRAKLAEVDDIKDDIRAEADEIADAVENKIGIRPRVKENQEGDETQFLITLPLGGIVIWESVQQSLHKISADGALVTVEMPSKAAFNQEVIELARRIDNSFKMPTGVRGGVEFVFSSVRQAKQFAAEMENRGYDAKIDAWFQQAGKTKWVPVREAGKSVYATVVLDKDSDFIAEKRKIDSALLHGDRVVIEVRHPSMARLIEDYRRNPGVTIKEADTLGDFVKSVAKSMNRYNERRYELLDVPATGSGDSVMFGIPGSSVEIFFRPTETDVNKPGKVRSGIKLVGVFVKGSDVVNDTLEDLRGMTYRLGPDGENGAAFNIMQQLLLATTKKRYGIN